MKIYDNLQIEFWAIGMHQGVKINSSECLQHSAWEIMIGHLGHFLLDFFCQIWTQGTIRLILGSILVIFEMCHFLGGLSVNL